MKKSSLVVLMSLISTLSFAQQGARQAAPTTGTRTGTTTAAPSAAGSTAGSVGNAGTAAGSGSLANPTSAGTVNNALPSAAAQRQQSSGAVSVSGLAAPAANDNAAPARSSARRSREALNNVVESRVEAALGREVSDTIAGMNGNNSIDTAIEQEVASHALAIAQMNIDSSKKASAAIADANVAKATGTTLLDSGVADCAQNMDAEAQNTLADLTIAGGASASKGIASVAAAAQAKHQESTGKGAETFGKLAGACKLVKQQVVSSVAAQ